MKFFYKYFEIIFSILFDAKTSIKDDIANTIAIIPQSIVCLIISIFMFSLLLSFIIDLYNLKQLTAIVKIAGINNIFCNNKLLKIKEIPFPTPKTLTNADIV